MIEESREGEVVLIRLTRPEKLNAWDTQAREAFRHLLVRLDDDTSVKAVVVTGEGEKAFCAGADLNESGIGVPSDAKQRMGLFLELFRTVISFRKPLVAALNGLAVGSAFQVVLLMDYRVGHSAVKLGLPEINSGIPTISGSTILSWALGINRTREISVSGRMVFGQEALSLGLIEELVEPASVLPRALEVATELAGKSPKAYAETKAWLRDLRFSELEAAMDRAFEIRQGGELANSIQSGVAAFTRKA